MSKLFLTRLKELQGDIPVAAFARFLEMPQKTVDTYFKEQRKPSVEFIVRVCSKCGVSADWLLGLSETRAPLNVAAPTSVLPIKPRKNPFTADTDLLTEIAAMKRRMQELEAIAIKQLNQPSVCVG